MKRTNFAILLVFFSTLILATIAYRAHKLITNPKSVFLISEHGASWIKEDAPLSVFTQSVEPYQVFFAYRFSLEEIPDRASLVLKVFRSYRIYLNRELLERDTDNPTPWITSDELDITPFIQSGSNELVVVVENSNGPPALMAYSEELDISTGENWITSSETVERKPATLLALRPPFPISREFPSAAQSLLVKLPVFSVLFILGFTASFLLKSTKLRPDQIRWLMIVAWTALCVNNIAKIPDHIGFDVPHHYDYIDHIVQTGTLPLASDGGQMFQAPLFYILSAPLLLLFYNLMSVETTLLALRVVPMLCGLAQIEIAFRTARIVFPKRVDLQSIGTAMGGLLPMNIYMSQVVGNEPLSGCLTALVICYCLCLLMSSSTGSMVTSSIRLGILYGLALLAKVTALLLFPILVLMIAYLAISRRHTPGRTVLSMLGFALASVVVAGWYYLRNWILLGQPFIGPGWDPATGKSWWQDPGYRVPQDLLSFGEALVYPIYSSISGFWDGLYSSFWLDAYLGSTALINDAPPWNYGFMLSMALLSIPMAVALVAGALSVFKAPFDRLHGVRLFSVCCLGLYLAALVYLFITVSNYSAVKSTYTLGLLPCYTVLITSGFGLVQKSTWSRALISGYLCGWLVFGYVAYFVW